MRRAASIRKSQFDCKEKDIIYCGWLKKQSGKFKRFQRRYFILVKNMLYYFTNQNRNVLKGQINLKNLELSLLEQDKTNSEYNFHILPEQGKDFINEGHNKYTLSTNDKKEAENWIYHLKQSMYLEKGGGLFGTPLKTLIPYLKEEFSYVPRVIFECCQHIRKHGMNEEGIFRKNGQLSQVLQLKEKIDRAVYHWEDVDIHSVCSVLKLYLRELPEPLIPFCHYDSLKAVGYRIDVKENLDLVRDKLFILPLPNLQLLKYLCQFLTEVSSYPGNRMEISSLAKVFSPNILRDQDTDPYVEETTNSVITVTVAAFIKSQDELFQFQYEPLLKYDKESIYEEHDTYSLKSAVSYINFRNSLTPDNDASRSVTSLPHIQQSENRVQSMVLFNNNLSSLSEPFRSEDTNFNTLIKPRIKLSDYSEKTPIFSKKMSIPNGNGNDEEDYVTFVYCSGCVNLMTQLSKITEDRDRLQRSYDLKSKMCVQFQEELEYLRSELLKYRRVLSTNTSDLSDLLDYFQINKF